MDEDIEMVDFISLIEDNGCRMIPQNLMGHPSFTGYFSMENPNKKVILDLSFTEIPGTLACNYLFELGKERLAEFKFPKSFKSFNR